MSFGILNKSFNKIAQEVGMEPVMFDVESSNIQQIGYDSEQSQLYIRFMAKGNSPSTLYVYHDVEPELWEELFAAESKGKYLHQYVKQPGYAYDRIE